MQCCWNYGVASRQSGWRLALCTGVSPNLLESSLGSKWRCCRRRRALAYREPHQTAQTEKTKNKHPEVLRTTKASDDTTKLHIRTKPLDVQGIGSNSHIGFSPTGDQIRYKPVALCGRHPLRNAWGGVNRCNALWRWALHLQHTGGVRQWTSAFLPVTGRALGMCHSISTAMAAGAWAFAAACSG